jgi:hypothetical protein
MIKNKWLENIRLTIMRLFSGMFSNQVATKAVYIDGSQNISPEITAAIAEAKNPVVAVLTTPTSTLTTNTSLADVFTVTLSQSVTMTCSGGVNGKGTTWLITQGSGGGKVVTLDSGFVLPSSASALAWSTVAGKTDILAARYSSTSGKWLVVSFVPGYSATPA